MPSIKRSKTSTRGQHQFSHFCFATKYRMMEKGLRVKNNNDQ